MSYPNSYSYKQQAFHYRDLYENSWKDSSQTCMHEHKLQRNASIFTNSNIGMFHKMQNDYEKKSRITEVKLISGRTLRNARNSSVK